ncbi:MULTISPECIES: hypothetical protein [Bradyrhizobium]|uniref:hypothetical protein n=1 Tax=Bradyrhizobium TaxID=374 RepID=UPI0020A052B9|nr:hypothetical protein [Bradyrhizobium elkanii]MCP1969900.1 hypothetical protein [Bradyrhizobium elkanii]MCS4108592.1 hypothetical protein [Bradyrhizobium elkanii]
MADTYQTAKAIAHHVDLVVAHLATSIGQEPAIMRVMDHLQIVLQDALDGGDQADMAMVLAPGGTEARPK